jgi:hypothetical protein
MDLRDKVMNWSKDLSRNSSWDYSQDLCVSRMLVCLFGWAYCFLLTSIVQQDADASACVGSYKSHSSKAERILLVGENFGDLRYGVVQTMTSLRTTPRPESTAFHWRYVLPRFGNLIGGSLKRKLATYVLKIGRI